MGMARKMPRVGCGEGPKKTYSPGSGRVGNRGYTARLRGEPGNFKRSTNAKKGSYIRRQYFDVLEQTIGKVYLRCHPIVRVGRGDEFLREKRFTPRMIGTCASNKLFSLIIRGWRKNIRFANYYLVD
jgi:hypothetical protein